MQNFYQACPQMTSMPMQYNPVAAMPQQQLETMYPKSYQIIKPEVENMCDRMVASNGQMYTPTQQQLDAMIDDIYGNVEADVSNAVKEGRDEERQFYGGGRRILRDFIGALLITSLIGRRPYGFYPGFYPGYYPGFYGSYGYY